MCLLGMGSGHTHSFVLNPIRIPGERVFYSLFRYERHFEQIHSKCISNTDTNMLTAQLYQSMLIEDTGMKREIPIQTSEQMQRQKHTNACCSSLFKSCKCNTTHDFVQR